MTTTATQTVTAQPSAPSNAAPTILDSARRFFSLQVPVLGQENDSKFKFLTSPQRAKPAASVNADSFYMYACGSINMP